MEKPWVILSLLLIISQLSLFALANSAHQDFANCTAVNNISNIVHSPSDSNFTTILNEYVRNKRFNRPDTRKPTLIVTPTEETHVSTIVRCAKASNISLKIRSGGHNYEGISYVSDDDFVILDMFNLRSISIDNNTITPSAWVGAGASLGELYSEISSQTPYLSFPGGVCPTVGIGGHISGGGFGNMLRKFGLAIDHVNDAKIVVVDGSILNRSTMGSDLFWAICGGGGASFGVILSYKISLVYMPTYTTVFTVKKNMSENATGILYEYLRIAPALEDTLFIRAVVQPFRTTNSATIRTTYIGMFLGDIGTLMNLILPNFPSLGLNESDCNQTTKWIETVLYWAKLENSTKGLEALRSRTSYEVEFFKGKSDYIKNDVIPISKLDSLFETMMDNGEAGMEFSPYGGTMNSDTDTPFPHRRNRFEILYFVNWENSSKAAEHECMEQIGNLYNNMTDCVTSNPREAYFNHQDLDIGTNEGQNDYTLAQVYGRPYFMANFDRLVNIKTAVDPSNFFNNEQSIPTRGVT